MYAGLTIRSGESSSWLAFGNLLEVFTEKNVYPALYLILLRLRRGVRHLPLGQFSNKSGPRFVEDWPAAELELVEPDPRPAGGKAVATDGGIHKWRPRWGKGVSYFVASI